MTVRFASGFNVQLTSDVDLYTWDEDAGNHNDWDYLDTDRPLSVPDHGYFQLNTSYNSYWILQSELRHNLIGPETELYISAVMKIQLSTQTYSGRFVPLVFFRDFNEAYQVSVGFVGGRTYPVFVSGTPSDPLTIYGATATKPIRQNEWFHLELKIVINSSTGSMELRKNGETILSVSGVDTDPTGTNEVSHVCFGSGTNYIGGAIFSIDSLVINDADGSWGNTWLNGAYVSRIDPDGTGTEQDYTVVGAANGYQAIDEMSTYGTAPNTSDYIETTDDTWEHACDVEAPSATYFASDSVVMGLVHTSYAQNADSLSFIPYFNINGTQDKGSGISLTPTWDWYYGIIDDKSGAQILWAELSNLEIGWAAS